jgi:hypothetical protein
VSYAAVQWKRLASGRRCLLNRVAIAACGGFDVLVGHVFTKTMMPAQIEAAKQGPLDTATPYWEVWDCPTFVDG